VSGYLAEIDLREPGGVEEAIDELISCLKSGYYLRWDAVVREEHGLELREAHEEALEELSFFGDEEEDVDDRVFYIDGVPRPSEPWFEAATRIVPYLLLEPFPTDTVKYEVVSKGWPRLVEALEDHAWDLLLPEGVASPVDIFPADLQHRLWLQTCFGALDGLGQDGALTLQHESQHWRVDSFIEDLSAHKKSTSYFDLTLEGLLQRTVMPPQDREILTLMMMDRLGLSSSRVPLAQVL